MKKPLTIIILILSSNISLFSQESISTLMNESEKVYENKLTDKTGKAIIYHPISLNLFFNDEVGKYFTNSNEVSTQKNYFTIDGLDKSLTFGISHSNTKGDLTKNMKWLGSLGFKLKGKKEGTFYTVRNSDGFLNNMGFSGKFHLFKNGSIHFGSKNESGNLESKLQAFRSNELYPEIKHSFNRSYVDTSGFLKKSQLALAQRELDFINKNKLYTYISKLWFTLDFYYPITENEYVTTLVSPDSLNADKSVSNWDVSLSGTLLLKKNKTAMTLSIFGRIYNNNNILTEGIKEKTFTKYAQNNVNQFNQVEEKSIYLGEFKEFITPQLKGELSIFPKNEIIGISGAIEQNFGDYDKLDWKMGIPFNLKDKDGKVAVAVEIQWREVNQEHFIGLSLGKPFGKYVD